MKAKAIALTTVLLIGALVISGEVLAGKKVKVVKPKGKRAIVVKNRRAVKPRVVVKLPAGHRKIIHKNRNFYYHAGVWYKPGTVGYVVAKAPVGVRVKVLPVGYTTVVFGKVTYFNFYGTYYRFDKSVNEYYVVESPGDRLESDIITKIDGEVLKGRYVGGDEETIEFMVDNEIVLIEVSDIVSMLFEPPSD